MAAASMRFITPDEVGTRSFDWGSIKRVGEVRER